MAALHSEKRRVRYSTKDNRVKSLQNLIEDSHKCDY